MSTEPNTGLTWQEANSQTTDALHNQVVDLLAAWLNCTVLAVGQAAPTGSEVEGDRYIVGTGTGAFAGHDDELAILRGGTWQFHAPPAAGVPIIKNLDDGADWECVGGVWAAKVAAGSTQGKHAIPIMAGAIAPSVSGGCAALASIASASNQPDIVSLDFDATTQEYAQFAIPLPKSWNGGTFTFMPVWSHAATTTDFGVVWDLQLLLVRNDDTIAAAFGTAQSSADTGGTTNDLYYGPESAAITPAGTAADNVTLYGRISRVTGNGSDTMAIDARLHGIMLFMTTDADTDA